MIRSVWTKCCAILAIVAGVTFTAVSAEAAGLALSGVGPINRAMGGAATAAPIDAGGALHWNPGSISGLPQSEVLFGMELILPTEAIGSSIAGGPTAWTKAEPGVAPVPTIAWVHKPEDSRWTYGLGMYGIAGYRVNYPQDPANPIVSQNGIFADVQILQIAPTIAYAITDKLSVGIAPTLTLGQVMINPLAFAEPVGGSYPSGQSTRYAWGGGIQAGVYYITDNCWHLGLSIKSPQWFEPFRYNVTDGNGNPAVVEVDLDYPMIISSGIAYSGFERLLLAADFRYFDYGNTNGFRNAGFGPTGALQGLGWANLFGFNLGAQYKLTDRLFVRGGYSYNESPITGSNMFTNIASPLMIQNIVSAGISYQLTCNVVFSATYIHGFENEVTGDFPLAPPGSTVSTAVSADALGVGFTVRY